MRIAAYNLENLFTRPAAMAEGLGEEGQQAIDDHAELNLIIAQAAYSAADKERLVELAERYGFALGSTPANALVLLQRVRGQLYSRSRAGVVTVKARGRTDWTGWFELRRSDVGWRATYNTARVIAEVKPDILLCVEIENRPTLLRFNEQVLDAQFQQGFAHLMVLDGNDDRGIDVGLMSRYPIRAVASHVDDRGVNGQRIFSRDCPEYHVELPEGSPLVLMPNHFKSKRGGNDRDAQARRLAQATRCGQIAEAALARTGRVLIGGDLNDTPGSEALAPLWQHGRVDVSDHPTYPRDRPGTYATGTAGNKIDYLICSPELRAALVEAGIERRGTYHPNTWKPFDTVTGKHDEASDHHLIWADFEV